VVWDKLLKCEVGWASFQADGSLLGVVPHGMSELGISGADARELAKNALSRVNWSLRN